MSKPTYGAVAARSTLPGSSLGNATPISCQCCTLQQLRILWAANFWGARGGEGVQTVEAVGASQSSDIYIYIYTYIRRIHVRTHAHIIYHSASRQHGTRQGISTFLTQPAVRSDPSSARWARWGVFGPAPGRRASDSPLDSRPRERCGPCWKRRPGACRGDKLSCLGCVHYLRLVCSTSSST